MAHHMQQTYTSQSVDETPLDLSKKGFQKHHQIHDEPVIQTDQMYRNPTVQKQTYDQYLNPQNAQFYRTEDIQQRTTYREINQEEQLPPQPKTKAHVYDICKQIVISRRNLAVQYAGHTGKEPWRLRAKYAPSIYREVNQEEQPPPQPKTKARVYDICKPIIISRRNLAAQYAGHTGIKPLVCQFCHKSFTLKKSFRKHYLMHTRGKPYVCEVCNRGFSQISTLKEHSLTHSGLKTQVCHICQKRFTQKATLMRHKLTHTGEKNHICEICNKRFSIKGNLDKHYHLHSADREGKKKNPQEANEQKGQIIIAEARREYQEVDLKQQVTNVQTEPEHCEVTFTENNSSHEQALMHTEHMENVQEFVTIDQS